MNTTATENLTALTPTDFAPILAVVAGLVIFVLAAWLTAKLARFVFEGFAIALTIGILVASFGTEAMPQAMQPVMESMKPALENARPMLDHIVSAIETVLS